MSDIPILTMSIYKDVADNKTIIDNIKTSATASGWTSATYQVDKQWASVGGGQYGWTSGTETFLRLTSTGFGSQSLDARIRYTPTNTIYLGAQKGEAIATNTSTHPVLQNQWNSSSAALYVPLSTTTIPIQWVFCNSKFVLCVLKLREDRVIYFSFGSIDLYDTTMTQGNFSAAWQSTDYSIYTYDTNLTTHVVPPFDHVTYHIYNNSSVATTNCLMEFRSTLTKVYEWTTPTNFGNFWGPGLSTILNTNDFSEYRPIMRQKVYWKDSDNVWYPLGQHFVARINSMNIGIGEEMQQGSERFIIFPHRIFDIEPCGLAVRIE